MIRKPEIRARKCPFLALQLPVHVSGNRRRQTYLVLDIGTELAGVALGLDDLGFLASYVCMVWEKLSRK